MINYKPYSCSFSLSAQDRFYINDTHQKSGDKGIKRASLWERITGRATTIIQDGQKYYVNTNSLKNYLHRKVLACSGSSKIQEVAKEYFFVSSCNDSLQTYVKGEEKYKRRGDILTGLEDGNRFKIRKGYQQTEDLVEFFSNAGKRALGSTPAELFGVRLPQVSGHSSYKNRPKSWPSETRVSSQHPFRMSQASE